MCIWKSSPVPGPRLCNTMCFGLAEAEAAAAYALFAGSTDSSSAQNNNATLHFMESPALR